MLMKIPKAIKFNPGRLRSYILRLPLFTRAILVVIALFWVLELQTAWSVIAWGCLKPSEVGLTTMYRLNTFPIIHAGFVHALLNALALTPLLERFEREHGTLTTVALFIGPISTFPGGIYVLIQKFILPFDTAVLGASTWVFLLLGIEAIKTFHAEPYFTIGPNRFGTYKLPTWITPLALAVLISFLMPNSSFLGHIISVLVGYLFGLGYMRFLFPPEKILRWIEAKLNLLGILPHYVSVDQKTYGRYGILPTGGASNPPPSSVAMNYIGSTQRLGP